MRSIGVGLKLCLVAMAAGLVFAMAGCGSDSEPSSGAASAPDDKVQAVSNDASLESVPVSVAEFEIKMPATLPRGPTKFAVTNVGQLAHNLEIKGEGIDRLLAEEPIGPGDKAVMQINLRPGDYVAYCPMFNHRDKGMEFKFKVK